MYNSKEKNILLQQVNTSILFGLEHHSLMECDVSQVPQKLLCILSCFVTLHLNGRLRGCIGSLNATQTLIEDVNYHAYAAAFNDPRFHALTFDEYQNIETEISVLSTPENIIFNDERDLLAQLHVGIDGIIFEYQQYRATYLPSVWSSLQTPKLFINSLKEKAGLNSNFWSKEVRCQRYTTESIKTI